MINQTFKQQLRNKIEEGKFGAADIPSYFTLFCEFGNALEDLQEEVEDWDRRLNFVLEGLGTFWMEIRNGQFSSGEGERENPHLVLTFDAAEAAKVFSGEVDAVAAYMSGTLRVKGELPDAVKFQTLVEIVTDEIEYE
ncbi:MAG: SCP2 sterol-binding domain-containing protein [Candidatus Promineifilaceae bacterium]|nr:SCP2 sterol-binding domain-containing protein [Candidatus Promineifilaceae bacterium]